MVIKKTVVDMYTLRGEVSRSYADITLNDSGEMGRLTIVSSYGEWSYFWASCGQPFKEFIAHLDMYYAARAFKENDWVDVGATLAKFKSEILTAYKDGVINKVQAKALIGEVDSLEGVFCVDFYLELARLGGLMGFFKNEPPVTVGIQPRFKAFWGEVWHAFRMQLLTEIAQGVSLVD